MRTVRAAAATVRIAEVLLMARDRPRGPGETMLNILRYVTTPYAVCLRAEELPTSAR